MNVKSDSGPTRSGPLTAQEIEELRLSYLGGARGALLIGTRREERLLTLLVPSQATVDALSIQLIRNAETLRRLGADGFILARRARTQAFSKALADALFICERGCSRERQLLVRLAGGKSAEVLWLGTDRLAKALAESLGLATS